MISGNYRKIKSVWEDDTIKVEKSHRSFDRHDDETDPIIIDITLEDESESESETEESYCSYHSQEEFYTWADEEPTVTADGNIEITLKRVNVNVIGYNKDGKIKEEKPRPRTIKII